MEDVLSVESYIWSVHLNPTDFVNDENIKIVVKTFSICFTNPKNFITQRVSMLDVYFISVTKDNKIMVK